MAFIKTVEGKVLFKRAYSDEQPVVDMDAKTKEVVSSVPSNKVFVFFYQIVDLRM